MLLEGLIFVAVIIAMIVFSEKKKRTIRNKINAEKDEEIKKAYQKELKKADNNKIFYIFLLVAMIAMVFIIIGVSK